MIFYGRYIRCKISQNIYFNVFNIISKYLVILFIIIGNLIAQDELFLQYIFPKPGSQFISTKTTIIMRFHTQWTNYVNPASLSITAIGEESGWHQGKIVIADDRRTAIFKPLGRFAAGETVQVKITGE